jgi:hypothetical protein
LEKSKILVVTPSSKSQRTDKNQGGVVLHNCTNRALGFPSWPRHRAKKSKKVQIRNNLSMVTKYVTMHNGYWSNSPYAPTNAPVPGLWETTSLHDAPANAISSLILLYCWELWKHQHDVVFRGMNLVHEHLIAACRQNTKLWQCRLPRNNTPVSSLLV